LKKTKERGETNIGARKDRRAKRAENRVKRRNKNGYRDTANSGNAKRRKRAMRVTEKERDRERKMDHAMVESFLKLQRLRVFLSLSFSFSLPLWSRKTFHPLTGTSR